MLAKTDPDTNGNEGLHTVVINQSVNVPSSMNSEHTYFPLLFFPCFHIGVVAWRARLFIGLFGSLSSDFYIL
jgi:hypothetical protein